MAPSPVLHSIVCASEAAIEFEATVSVMTVDDDVAAVSVAEVLPSVTVQTGTFALTKITELAVMVMVSATPSTAVEPT
mgnify:CR=1 FL=1|jgi:hypothetical protein